MFLSLNLHFKSRISVTYEQLFKNILTRQGTKYDQRL